MTVVETERLVLRRFTPDDAEFILRLLNEPSFIANIADRGVRTVEQAAAYLADAPIRMYAEHGHGLYLVALKEEGMPIGMCGLLRRDQFPDVDLGYAFLPEFWSHGYAAEAARAMLEHAKRDLGLDRLIALVAPHNAGSIRLLEKLGFAFSHNVRMKPDAPETAIYVLAQL